LQKAQPVEDETARLPEQQIIDALEAAHYRLWSQARDDYQEETRRLASYRSESLKRSHQAHIQIIQERLAQVNEERIRRMYEGQLANAAIDFQRRITELEEAVQRADILAQRVAIGVVIVENKETT
jgi:hypothetical protein